MKKKLLTLAMGLGIALGASNVSAYACACETNLQGCLDDGGSYAGCNYKYQHCLRIHDAQPGQCL